MRQNDEFNRPPGRLPLGNRYGFGPGAYNNSFGMTAYYWALGMGGRPGMMAPQTMGVTPGIPTPRRCTAIRWARCTGRDAI